MCVLYRKSKLVRAAIRLDAVDVRAFTYRPLQDGFEWEAGYTMHSGLYHVNFTDPFRPRTPRRSALYFAELARTRGVLRDSAPEPTSPPPATPSRAPLPQNGAQGNGQCTPTGGAGGTRTGGGVWYLVTVVVAAVFWLW